MRIVLVVLAATGFSTALPALLSQLGVESATLSASAEPKEKDTKDRKDGSTGPGDGK